MNNRKLTLLTLTVHAMDDVIKARQRARQISALLKFDTQDQTKIATAVSEIARNAYKYAGTGKVEFCLRQSTGNSLGIRISDKGPGIKPTANASLENMTANNNQGGIDGARRVMDKFDITSERGKGTTVWMEMDIPKHALPITQQTLAVITSELARHRTESVSEEVQQQNYELLHALDLLAKARDELEVTVQSRTAQLTEAYQALQQEISERKQAEERLQKQQLELARNSRLTSMGEMGSALAHELNQPLTAITTFTQGCIRRLEASTYPVKEILTSMKIVAEQAERAGSIIHRMKDFVAQGKLSNETLIINQVIENVIELMNYETREIAVIYKLNLASNLLPVTADKIQIEQVLVNLIRNAIEAMQMAQTIAPMVKINTRAIDKTHIEIQVIDNGPGFSREIASKVLEPYFTTKPQGMGMGLSISRTIIEAYGGHMLAKPQPKGGAWFEFTLPIAKGADND